MRTSYESEWLRDPDHQNIIMGLSLGADFCAEHEWGIKGIQKHFQMDGSKDGIERRRIRHIPKGLDFYKGHGVSILFFQSPLYDNVKTDVYDFVYNHFNIEHFIKRDKRITAWDEKSFCVVVSGKEEKWLRNLYDAFLEKNVAIWLGGGHAFKNSGLCIMDITCIPEKNKNEMLESDLDHKRLISAADKTGIQNKIDEIGGDKRYFALRPRWIVKDEAVSKYPVMFFLNPYDQKNNNFGWFTVEELELWLENKGPIPKAPEKVSDF